MSYTSFGRGGAGGRSGSRSCREVQGGAGYGQTRYGGSSNSKFKGKEDKLSGYISDCGDAKHVEKYGTTLEEIFQFNRTRFTDGEQFVKAMMAWRELWLPNRPPRPIKLDVFEDQTQAEVDRTYDDTWTNIGQSCITT